MKFIYRGVAPAALALLLWAGCGRNQGPELAAAGGQVTYKGKPLANASVVFMPEIGPAAYGNTNDEGAFQLLTRGQRGAKIGPGKFLITAVEQVGEMKREEEMTTRELQNMYKPLIPAKYGRPDQSGLTGVVEPKGENHFQLDLE